MKVTKHGATVKNTTHVKGNYKREQMLMEEITRWYGKYPIIYKVLYIQTVVVWDFWTINSMNYDNTG